MLEYKIHNDMDHSIFGLDLLSVWEVVSSEQGSVEIPAGGTFEFSGYTPEFNTVRERFAQAVLDADGVPGSIPDTAGTVWLE